MAKQESKLVNVLGVIGGVVGGISAVLEKSGKLVELMPDFLKKIGAANTPTRWALIIVLFALGCWAIWRFFERKSKLKNPDRFLVSPDDPRFLKGREMEVTQLLDLCTQRGLVFLEGESGAGKTALLRSGLIPACKKENKLFPIYIDLALADWEDRLTATLGQEIWNGLSEAEQKKIPKEASPQDKERKETSNEAAPQGKGVWEMLKLVGTVTHRSPLLIIDQFDDYQMVHQARFRKPGSNELWATVDELIKANGFWREIAALVRDKKVNMLVATLDRKFSGLAAVRFVDAAQFTISRVKKALIAPLLEELTAGDPKDVVVANPEAGWERLKERLLNDLTEKETILPVQLSVCVQALHELDALTGTNYELNGKARGLERLHIQENINKAAKSSRLEADELRTALLCLTDDDGRATVSSSLEAMAKKLRTPERVTDLKEALEWLERAKIVRRLASTGDTDAQSMWSLHHNFLARGLIDADRWKNRWALNLLERAAAFRRASRWSERWRALLSPREQWDFLLARLQRLREPYFHYRSEKGFALISLLRFVPIVAFALIVVLTYNHFSEQTAAERARTAAAGLGHNTIGEAEVRRLYQLSETAFDVRLSVLRLMLEEEDALMRASWWADYLIHGALQLDPTGRGRRTLRHDILGPVVNSPTVSSAQLVVSLHWAASAGLDPAFQADLTRKLVEKITPELTADTLTPGCEILMFMVWSTRAVLAPEHHRQLLELVAKIVVHQRRGGFLWSEYDEYIELFGSVSPATFEVLAPIIADDSRINLRHGEAIARLFRSFAPRMSPSAWTSVCSVIVKRLEVGNASYLNSILSVLVLSIPDEPSADRLLRDLTKLYFSHDGHDMMRPQATDVFVMLARKSPKAFREILIQSVEKQQYWFDRSDGASFSLDMFSSSDAEAIVSAMMEKDDDRYDKMVLLERLIPRLTGTDVDRCLERARSAFEHGEKGYNYIFLAQHLLSRASDPRAEVARLSSVVSFGMPSSREDIDKPVVSPLPEWFSFLPEDRQRAYATWMVEMTEREGNDFSFIGFYDKVSEDSRKRLARAFEAKLIQLCDTTTSKRKAEGAKVYSLMAAIAGGKNIIPAVLRPKVAKALLDLVAQDPTVSVSVVGSEALATVVEWKDSLEPGTVDRLVQQLLPQGGSPSPRTSSFDAVPVLAPLVPILEKESAKKVALRMIGEAWLKTSGDPRERLIVDLYARLEPGALSEALYAFAEKAVFSSWYGDREVMVKYFVEPARRLDPPARSELVRRIGERIEHDSAVIPWLHVLAELVPQMTESEREQALKPLLIGIQTVSHQTTLVVPAALSEILRYTNATELIELLKTPTCVDSFRQAILRAMELKWVQRFENGTWDFVKWAQSAPSAKGLHIDLESPPRYSAAASSPSLRP